MIRFENVTKVYVRGGAPALDDVTLEIERDEFVFMVGKSGSGWVFFEVPRDFSSGVLEIWDFSFDAEDVYLKIG